MTLNEEARRPSTPDNTPMTGLSSEWWKGRVEPRELDDYDLDSREVARGDIRVAEGGSTMGAAAAIGGAGGSEKRGGGA